MKTEQTYSLVSKYRGVVLSGLNRDDAIALADLMGKDTHWVWVNK